MNSRLKHSLVLLVLAVLLLIVSVLQSHALPSFGSQVETACQAFKGTTPFATQSCALCHNSGSLSLSDLIACELPRAETVSKENFLATDPSPKTRP